MEGNHTIVGKGTNGCNLEKNRIIYLGYMDIQFYEKAIVKDCWK